MKETNETTQLNELVGSALQMYGHLPAEELKRFGYKKPENNVDEMAENTADYWNKINNMRVQKTLTRGGRNVLIKQTLNRLAQRDNITEFIPDEKQIVLMKHLNEYFMGISKVLTPEKGLILMGDTGVGKTTILTAFLSVPYCSFSDFDLVDFRAAKFRSCISVIQDYNRIKRSNENTDWLSENLFGDIYFSDLGSEPTHDFARKDEESLMSKVIEQRYLHKSGRTFFCTNLNQDEIARKYGKRINSRLAQMCHFIDLNESGIIKDYRTK